LQYPPATQNTTVPAEPSDEDSAVHRVFDSSGSMTGHSTIRELGDLSPFRLMALLEDRAIDAATRLVGWAPKTIPGQQVHPKTDQAIGFTIFVVHLSNP